MTSTKGAIQKLILLFAFLVLIQFFTMIRSTMTSLMLDFISLTNICQQTVFCLQYLLVTNVNILMFFCEKTKSFKIIVNKKTKLNRSIKMSASKIWNNHLSKNPDFSSFNARGILDNLRVRISDP